MMGYQKPFHGRRLVIWNNRIRNVINNIVAFEQGRDVKKTKWYVYIAAPNPRIKQNIDVQLCIRKVNRGRKRERLKKINTLRHYEQTTIPDAAFWVI